MPVSLLLVSVPDLRGAVAHRRADLDHPGGAGREVDAVVLGSFVEACIKAGVQLDYFPYPTHEHNVRGRDRVHLMQKVTDYFDERL